MSNEEIQTPDTGTEVEVTTENPTEAPIAEPEVDYKEKFSQSSREALRLLDEAKEKERLLAEAQDEIDKLKTSSGGHSTIQQEAEELFPGFNILPEDEQQNLIAYTDSIQRNTLSKVYKDPAIAFAKQTYNEKRWQDAFNSVSEKYPELKQNKDEFKQKYFNAGNVPDNIDSILEDLSKVYLFDKAKDLGAQEAAEKNSHIEIERANGGDKTPQTSSRSLEDWTRMAEENPAQFAKMAPQFREDLQSGKLK